VAEASIRRGAPRDLAPLAELYDHSVVHTAITFDIEPLGAEGRRGWIEGFAATGPHQLFVAEGPDGPLGYAASQSLRSMAAYQRSVETSVYVEPSHLGRGLGSRLYAALFAALASEAVHRAYAAITLPNAASVALHERFGFEPVGIFHEVGHKQGRYWDVGWYEKAVGPGVGG